MRSRCPAEDSLARPGANVTGSSFFSPELSAKRLELAKDADPSTRQIAALFNPDNPMDALLIHAMELAAKSLKLELQAFGARAPNEIERVISNAAKTGVDTLAVTEDPVFTTNYRR